MTYLITAEEAIAALKAEILDHGFHEEGQLMRLTGIIAAELTLARADAKAAQALVLEEATKRLAAARETFCYASPGSDEEFTSLLLGFDTAAGIIRDLAPDAGTAELAKLRGERDALLDAVQANMLRPDYLRAERAEAERDRLAAELAAANAREARKTFPILKGERASIDYQLVADHAEQARANHYQSVERLAERGGLSWCELYAVLHNRRWEKIDTNDAMIACRALEARYLAALAQPSTGGVE